MIWKHSNKGQEDQLESFAQNNQVRTEGWNQSGGEEKQNNCGETEEKGSVTYWISTTEGERKLRILRFEQQ